MTAIEFIIRDVCESDPEDTQLPDTVCIGLQALTIILERYLKPESQQAKPENTSDSAAQASVNEPYS